MTPNLIPQRRNMTVVAFHEAAHAVAAHEIDLWFDYVTIDDGQPRIEHSSPTSIERNSRWFPPKDLALYRLSGGIAEIRKSKKSYVSVFGWGGAKTDWMEFLRLGVDCESGLSAARRFVWDRWKRIAVIAGELLDRGTLSPEEVSRIISDSSQEGGAR